MYAGSCHPTQKNPCLPGKTSQLGTQLAPLRHQTRPTRFCISLVTRHYPTVVPREAAEERLGAVVADEEHLGVADHSRRHQPFTSTDSAIMVKIWLTCHPLTRPETPGLTRPRPAPGQSRDIARRGDPSLLSAPRGLVGRGREGRDPNSRFHPR